MLNKYKPRSNLGNNMFIQTETTPNPQTIKLIPGKTVMEQGVLEITDILSATNSPLAKRLFDVEGIISVFLGNDFITVTKNSSSDWQVIKPLALAAVMDHYTSKDPIVTSNLIIKSDEQLIQDDNINQETVDQIIELIETRVRPAVAQDGGDIIYKGFKDGVVFLHMRGACAGCPSSTLTLKNGIENMLKHYIPEVNTVEAIN
jgi:Fe-S cluster biogenesis protein NfuA